MRNLPSFGRLWVLCRLLDLMGSGCVVVDIKAIAELLELSPSSIRFYLRRCLGAGLFYRAVKLGPGLYKVFYVSQSKLCDRYGVSGGLGLRVGIAEIKDWRTVPIWAIAKGMQKRSRYAAMKAYKLNSLNQPVDTWRSANIDVAYPVVEQLFSSHSPAGARFIVLTDWERCYGTCQQTIAKHAGVSVQTARRHMQKLGRENIRQIATIDPDNNPSAKLHLQRQQHLKTNVRKYLYPHWMPMRLVRDRHGIFRPMTLKNNLYIFPESLVCPRLRRSKA